MLPSLLRVILSVNDRYTVIIETGSKSKETLNDARGCSRIDAIDRQSNFSVRANRSCSLQKSGRAFRAGPSTRNQQTRKSRRTRSIVAKDTTRAPGIDVLRVVALSSTRHGIRSQTRNRRPHLAERESRVTSDASRAARSTLSLHSFKDARSKMKQSKAFSPVGYARP